MPSLRVADVYAVKQDGDVLAGASAYADVGLCPDRASLPDIHACSILEQVVNTLHRGSGNLVAPEYVYNSRRMASCQRRARSRNVHLVEHHGLTGRLHSAVHLLYPGAYAVGLGIGKSGNTKRADKHLSAQARKERIALVAETRELKAFTLVENCFVHKI